MRATGEEILRQALELVNEPGSDVDEMKTDLEALARRSKFVLDTINAEAATAVGGPIRVRFTLPAAATSFKWRSGTPDGGSPLPDTLPSAVLAWSVVNNAGREEYRGDSNFFLTLEDWAVVQYDIDRVQGTDTPYALYWSRTTNADGDYEFGVFPATTRPDTEIVLYALVPKFERIDLTTEYELDQGRANYLVTRLALDAAAYFGMPVPPEVHQMALDAADTLGAFTREAAIQQVSTPRWLIGESRVSGSFTNRILFGGG